MKADLERLFEGHSLTETITEKFSESLTGLFISRFKEYGTDREATLRLSNVGQPLRKLWYTIKGFKSEPLSADNKVKFLFGDLIESMFCLLVEEAGHTVELLQQTVEVDGVVGHIDCVIDGVLVDLKSCSTPSYKKFKSSEIYESDPFGYVAQLTGYKQALGVDRAGWFIVDKTLGHFDFVELKPASTYDVSERIKTVRKALDSDLEPERCYSDKANDKQGNYVLDIGCNYCSFKEYCWRDTNNDTGLQLRHYSNGPRWFTKLVKEPRLKELPFEQFPTKG